jgi:hypothetical protein
MHASAQVGATSLTHIRRGARHTRPHAFPPPPLVTRTSHRRTHLRSTAPCRIHRVFTGGAPVQGAELSACMQPRPLAHHGHIGGPYRLTYRLPTPPFLSSSPTYSSKVRIWAARSSSFVKTPAAACLHAGTHLRTYSVLITQKGSRWLSRWAPRLMPLLGLLHKEVRSLSDEILNHGADCTVGAELRGIERQVGPGPSSYSTATR